MMKQVSLNPRLLQGLLAACLLAGPVTAPADPAAECRQEVQDYGIPPEQAQDYIDGCILSRGGALEPVPGAEYAAGEGMDTAPQQEVDYMEAPLMDAGQTEGMLPGGSDGTY